MTGERERIDARKRSFKEGDRVVVLGWAPSQVPGLEHGEPSAPVGTLGTVNSVDDAGTVAVTWDTGARLGCTLRDVVEHVR